MNISITAHIHYCILMVHNHAQAEVVVKMGEEYWEIQD